ncbi:MAG TPA: UDP-N-acetylmuramoyl-tripeptide--D-alanyl-D-alanine ligase, partial [bacterium]|nr:UDP-N-acetylmuramoyl-tripeptide--D-alanyl-D-alanine ligase [bacterium]
KTTVKDMIYHVFKDDRKTLKSPKSFNNHLGVPLTILEADPDTRLIVQEMEMNEPGGIKKLCGIAEPKYGVITNIGPAHLEFLKTIRNVYREKRELAEALPGDGALFINTDDPELRAINGRIKTRIICYSVRKPSDFKAEKIKSLSPGWEFYLKGIRFRLNVPGYFNICNSLAAASLASSLGLDLSYVAERLKTFRTGELRMEIIQKHGITFVLDCYNANPDSMKAAITAFLSEIPGKRKILILGDMLELGKKAGIYHRDIGSFLKKKKFRALLTTGSLSTHYGGTHFGSKEELKNNLKKLLKTGDAVLIKASRRLGLEELAK